MSEQLLSPGASIVRGPMEAFEIEEPSSTPPPPAKSTGTVRRIVLLTWLVAALCLLGAYVGEEIIVLEEPEDNTTPPPAPSAPFWQFRPRTPAERGDLRGAVKLAFPSAMNMILERTMRPAYEFAGVLDFSFDQERLGLAGDGWVVNINQVNIVLSCSAGTIGVVSLPGGKGPIGQTLEIPFKSGSYSSGLRAKSAVDYMAVTALHNRVYCTAVTQFDLEASRNKADRALAAESTPPAATGAADDATKESVKFHIPAVRENWDIQPVRAKTYLADLHLVDVPGRVGEVMLQFGRASIENRSNLGLRLGWADWVFQDKQSGVDVARLWKEVYWPSRAAVSLHRLQSTMAISKLSEFATRVQNKGDVTLVLRFENGMKPCDKMGQACRQISEFDGLFQAPRVEFVVKWA